VKQKIFNFDEMEKKKEKNTWNPHIQIHRLNQHHPPPRPHPHAKWPKNSHDP